ncbi:hypothetical protein MSPP1_000816 [Malassezia sp. CBS 17886]|nr:hypothetical protein MSPP1_000816 [Malassezia sp. CBS 17886]
MAFSFGKPTTGMAPPASGTASGSFFGAASAARPGAGVGAPAGVGATPSSAPAGQQPGVPSFGFGAAAGQTAQPGQTAGAPSAWGSANPGQSTPAPSLFGASQPAQQQPQNTLFGSQTGGAAPSMQASGGLFGSTTQQPPQQNALFGASTQSQQQGPQYGAPKQPGQGLFGSTAQPPNGMFGASASKPGGLFGQSTAAPQPTAVPPPGALFGAGGQATSGAAVPDRKLGAPMNAQLERIRASWDPSNLGTCQFQYYLYNRAPDAQALQQLCVRRADATGPMHDALWAKAMQENPNPEQLYPVLAVGFGDLQTRVNAQTAECARQRTKLAELATKLAALQQKHDLSNVVRAESAMLRQTRIHQRLLHLVKDSYLLMPVLRGQCLTAQEDNLEAVLENCELQLNGPSGEYVGPVGQHTRLRAGINELWAQVGALRAKREGMHTAGRSASGNTEWAVVDEAGFDEIAGILASLQQGLAHLTNTIMSDTKTLDTVCDGLADVPLVGVRGR